MTQTDYTELLRLQVGTAPVPQPVPEGVYYGQIDGVPKVVDRKKKDGSTSGVLQIHANLFEPGDDVDQDALAEMGGLVSESGQRRRVTKEFWIASREDLFPVDAFLAGFGITLDSKSSYTDAFQKLAGQAVAVTVIVDEFESNGMARSNNKVKKMIAHE